MNQRLCAKKGRGRIRIKELTCRSIIMSGTVLKFISVNTDLGRRVQKCMVQPKNVWFNTMWFQL